MFDSEKSVKYRNMLEHALDLYVKEDVLTALAYLALQKSEIEVVEACGELVVKLYWEKKDLSGVLAVALFGLALGWRTAEVARDNEEVSKILSLTKTISYNLASFTWPGWDESGIQIGQTDLALGLVAAKTNLRLAHELDKGYLPLARGYWMLAAHFLARKEYAQADRNFALSAQSATSIDAQGEVLLAEGFQVLVQLLGGTVPESQATEQMQEIKDKLHPLEGGSSFIEQLDTAYCVFVSKSR